MKSYVTWGFSGWFNLASPMRYHTASVIGARRRPRFVPSNIMR